MDIFHCPYSIFHQKGTRSHQCFLQGNDLALFQGTARPGFLSMGNFLVLLSINWLCYSSQFSPVSPGWGLCSLGMLFKTVHPPVSSILLPFSVPSWLLAFPSDDQGLLSLGAEYPSQLLVLRSSKMGPGLSYHYSLRVRTIPDPQKVYNKYLMCNSVNTSILLPAIQWQGKKREKNENNKHRVITQAQEILEYSAGMSLVFMKHKWAHNRVFPLLFPFLLAIPKDFWIRFHLFSSSYFSQIWGDYVFLAYMCVCVKSRSVDICICVSDSLCCTADTSNIVNKLYPNKSYFKKRIEYIYRYIFYKNIYIYIYILQYKRCSRISKIH